MDGSDDNRVLCRLCACLVSAGNAQYIPDEQAWFCYECLEEQGFALLEVVQEPAEFLPVECVL